MGLLADSIAVDNATGDTPVIAEITASWSGGMSLTYFKRYRMEIALADGDYYAPRLADDYRFVAWNPELIDVHAEVKYHSFRSEVDASVFPCFNGYESCVRLMDEIARKKGFLASATWLVEYIGAGPRKREYCGTIQGLSDAGKYGAIQNVGVTPMHRGRGLATALVRQSLNGFRRAGIRRVYLEVTAQNEPAVQLYQRLGFRRTRTLYKAVEVAYS